MNTETNEEPQQCTEDIQQSSSSNATTVASDDGFLKPELPVTFKKPVFKKPSISKPAPKVSSQSTERNNAVTVSKKPPVVVEVPYKVSIIQV